MEVGQGPNWGCSAKEKKVTLVGSPSVLGHSCLTFIIDVKVNRIADVEAMESACGLG
jgi:hypothetical protein